MTEPLLAWHFCQLYQLRDGRAVPPDGEMLRHDGELIPCHAGLHASERLLDALAYAPGPLLCRVRLSGARLPHSDDKFVSAERTILWRFDATDLLRVFARRCGLDVAHLWNAPGVVRDYLETGQEDLRKAAGYAAADGTIAATYAGSAAHAAHAAADAARAAHAAGRAAAYAAAHAAGRAAVSAAYAVSTARASDVTAVVVVTRTEQNARLTALVAEAAAQQGYSMDGT